MKDFKTFREIVEERAKDQPQLGKYLKEPNPLYAMLGDMNAVIDAGEDIRSFIPLFEQGSVTPALRTEARRAYTRAFHKYEVNGPFIDFQKEEPTSVAAGLKAFMGTIDPRLERNRQVMAAAVEKGIKTGEYVQSPEAARRVYQHILSTIAPEHRRLIEALEGDPDLQATALYLIDPIVEKVVGEKFGDGQLYRIVHERGSRSKQKASLPSASYIPPEDDGFLPTDIEQLLKLLSREQFDPEAAKNAQQRDRIERLRDLIHVKVERETFHFFKNDPYGGLERLAAYVESSDHPNIRDVCGRLRTLYEESLDLDIPEVNPDFVDPRSGKMGTLPSLHQRIGIYRILKDRSLGIFDGPGTGKTAQAALAFPLLERRLEQQGRQRTGRAIVVCPNESKSVWATALSGSAERRVFKDPVRSLAVVNGHRDIERIANSQWVVVNYEQLPTAVEYGGRKMPFAEYLTAIGFDYLILDEVHEVKSHDDITSGGETRAPQLTYSAACRILTNHAHRDKKYLTLLSGTPIMDKMEDYAVLYHMLDPERLPDPSQFWDLYQDNPRSLSTLVRQHTIRRRAEDINEDLQILEWDMGPWQDSWDMDQKQKTIYEHILAMRRRDWLAEARKALLDPRLVDPALIAALGIDTVTVENSAKYRRLADVLSAPDGPVAKGKKTVVFSSEFKRGVTRVHEELAERYKKAGLSTDGLQETLATYLHRRLREAFGVDREILVLDGDVPMEERDALLDRFRNTDAPVLLCTTETGGQSIDLTCANYMTGLDDDYSPGKDEQGIRRLARPGQDDPVYAGNLRLHDTIDEDVAEYVRRKALIQQIVLDGYPPTPEEAAVLGDDSLLKERIKRRFGGISIDLSLMVHDLIADPGSIITKRGKFGSRERQEFANAGKYESTPAQQVRSMIMQDPLGCWHDPRFVEQYLRVIPELSVYAIQRAKLVDFARRIKEGAVPLPRRVLSEGSGPGLLYSAYQDLEPLFEELELDLPTVFDRDVSLPILRADSNPYKIRGCMTGASSCIRDESMDMVDHESLTLLRNAEDVKAALIESNRVLRQGGTLEAVIKNYRFSKNFDSGLERLGFEPITDRNQMLAPSKPLLRQLRMRYGDHFANSFASKMSNTYVVIARKRDAPDLATPADYLWFDRVGSQEEETPDSQIVGQAARCEMALDGGAVIEAEGRRITTDKWGTIVRVERVK